MTDSDVVQDDIDSDYQEEPSKRRRWYVLVAVILALLLLLCACVTASQTWLLRGNERAQFVARNIGCLQCHVELIPDFSRTTVHSPFALKQCTTCHTPHGRELRVTVSSDPGEVVTRYMTLIKWLPLRWWIQLTQRSWTKASTAGGAALTSTTVKAQSGTSYLVAAETELCWTCHGSMGRKLGDAYQHQPFATGHCTSCHDPHASDHDALLTQAANRICFTCHPIGAEINRAQAHPPAKQGWCIDCHDPHASNYRGILVARQRVLCFSCHPTVAGLSGMPVQHAPFINDNCTGCHQPHGSDYPPLLNAEQPALCYDCHPGIENQFGQPSRHPVGLVMQCDTCHDPHAAQYAGLLDAGGGSNGFCYQCHSEIRVSFKRSSHKGQLCVQCHTPHGSPYRPLLVERNPEVCLQCHPRSRFDGPTQAVFRNNHPVRPNNYDVNAQAPLSCTSSCHNPHGTDKNFMLRYFESPYDGACLMCHAVTSGARVGIDY